MEKCNFFYGIIVLKLKGGSEVKEKTDQQLYQEFLEGNKQSFEKIVMKYKDGLIYFIVKYVRTIETAEDLVQDVFVYLLLHKENYQFQYSLKTYLYVIAKSKTLTYLKREKRITYLEEYEIQEEEKLEEKVWQQERQDNLKKAIKKLKTDYQIAIYLADIQELSYAEIAKILNKNIGQVKVLIHRARKALSKMVREEEEKYEG